MLTTTNTDAVTTVELASEFQALRAKIEKAHDAGRSASTLNRLWRKYFVLEDALKSRGAF